MTIPAVSYNPGAPPADMVRSRTDLNQVDFLQMLTAQMRSQDPMNPADSQNFASQLAQFSQLQQLQGMGTTMDQTLQANLMLAQTFNNTMAASFIGKTVRAEMDQFTLGASGSANLAYNLTGAATQIKVEVKDSDGKVVRTLSVNPQEAGEHTLSWDGMNDEGRRVGPGNYTYSVTATDPDGNNVPVSTYLEGRVTAVEYLDGNAVLTVNGMTVYLGQVMSISDPDVGSGDSAKRRG